MHAVARTVEIVKPEQKKLSMDAVSETWIKFCEPTFTRSLWIAEFWNTISSFAYCLPAIVLIWITERCSEEFPAIFTPGVIWRHRVCAVCWILLGLGSAAFHATQTVWGELWDEIGMLAATLSINFCLYDLHPLTTSKRANWFYGLMLAFSIIVMAVYVQLMHHPFFAACFIASALVPLGITITLPIDINGGRIKLYEEKSLRETRAAGAAKLFAMAKINKLSLLGSLDRVKGVYGGVVATLLGYAIWHIDQKCVADGWMPTDGHLYEKDYFYWAHPLWHVCTAIGTFFFFDSMCKVRVESFYSPLVRRIGTGSFIPMFSLATSLRHLGGFGPSSTRKITIQ